MTRRTIAHVVFKCVVGKYTGGLERVAIELADAQAANGHDVEILAVGEPGQVDCATPSGARVRYFPGTHLQNTVVSKALIAGMAQEAGRYAAIHLHNTFHPLNLQARRFARRQGISLFAHPHGALDPSLFSGNDLNGYKKRVYARLIEVPTLNRCGAVFALSSDEDAQLRSLGVTAPIAIIPNGIVVPPSPGPETRLRFRGELGLGPEDLAITFVGRINRKKALHDIVDALGIADGQGKRVALLIVGNPAGFPDYTDELRAQIAERGLGDKVDWMGFADEARKAELFCASDMFIHASYSEGMATAILEAMAVGMPTLVTTGCYMGKAASAGAVLQVEQNVAAIADGIARLHDQPAERVTLGKKAQEYIAQEHSWPALSARIVDVYSQHGAPIPA